MVLFSETLRAVLFTQWNTGIMQMPIKEKQLPLYEAHLKVQNIMQLWKLGFGEFLKMGNCNNVTLNKIRSNIMYIVNTSLHEH